MLRRELLKALAAFMAAPVVASKAGGFTPPARPAEPEPAVFAVPEDHVADVSEMAPDASSVETPPGVPDLGISDLPAKTQALREALWSGDQLPVEINHKRDGRTSIMFFAREAAERLGTTEGKQIIARGVIARSVPVWATIYNGGAACEVMFQEIV